MDRGILGPEWNREGRVASMTRQGLTPLQPTTRVTVLLFAKTGVSVAACYRYCRLWRLSFIIGWFRLVQGLFN